MTILQKYLAKELLQYFFMVLISVVGIYLTVDFFEKIDDFLEEGVPLSRAAIFFALRLPFVVAQVMPVGVLLAVLIVFGLMLRNNEIVALKSSGVSIVHLFKTVLILGAMSGFLLFFFNEALVPISIGKANGIWRTEVKKKSAIASREKDIWIKGDHAISHVRYFMPSDETIFGVTLNYFDDGFRLIKRIDAEKGVYGGGEWHLFNVIEQELSKNDGNYGVTEREESPIRLDFLPEDLRRVAKQPEEMGYRELASYIRKVELEGYDATSYKVDLSAKVAFPFVCVIMSIIGVGLTFWRQKKEGLTGSIFWGILLAFVYWTVHSFCLSLGYGAILPPIVAAWLTNGIFLSFGIFALKNADS